MNKYLLTITLSSVLFGQDSQSAAKNISICPPPTPSIYHLENKPKIYPTNNLRKRVGAQYESPGRNIKIYGTIMDERCLPIKSAIVQIWHPDHNGYFKHTPSRNTYDYDLYRGTGFTALKETEVKTHNEMVNTHFTGSGSCTTNNKGEYTFFTIKPGSLEQATPYVNFHIQSQNLSPFQTKIFFQTNKIKLSNELLTQNISHQMVKKLTFEQQSKDTYSFNIIINTRDHHILTQ